MYFIEKFGIDKGNYHAEGLYHFKHPPERKYFHVSEVKFHAGKRYFTLD